MKKLYTGDYFTEMLQRYVPWLREASDTKRVHSKRRKYGTSCYPERVGLSGWEHEHRTRTAQRRFESVPLTSAGAQIYSQSHISTMRNRHDIIHRNERNTYLSSANTWLIKLSVDVISSPRTRNEVIPPRPGSVRTRRQLYTNNLK